MKNNINYEDYKNKNLKDLKNEIFYDDPELFYEIAKFYNIKIPKKYMRYVKKYDVEENLFFFESNLAKQYTGNPRYIYEKMIKKYPNFKFVWSYDKNKENIPGNAIVVKRKSKKYYKNLAKAKVVINNTVFPSWFLRPETFYLQTWHGTPYKRLHWDRDGSAKHTSPSFYVKSKGWDCLLSPNHYSTLKFKSAFKYNGEILESGYPANDIFYNKKEYESKRYTIRKVLGINKKSTVYLYAPTWRDGGHLGNMMFKFDLMLNPEKFLDHAPEDSFLLIRTHHMSDEGDEVKNLPQRVIDVSQWDDAVELMCAADVLITDYSSIVFDWYCSKKPVLYYVPDLKEYETKLRGAYFDIRKINCGILCESEKELYNNLEIKNPIYYEEFYNQFCSIHDGNSTSKVIEYIFKKNNLKKPNILKRILKL